MSCNCKSADTTITNKDILAILTTLAGYVGCIAAYLQARWGYPVVHTGADAHDATLDVWLQTTKDTLVRAELVPATNGEGSAQRLTAAIHVSTVESGAGSIVVAKEAVLVPDTAGGQDYRIAVQTIVPKGAWYKVAGTYTPGFDTDNTSITRTEAQL